VFADQADRFQAVFALRDYVHVGQVLEQVGELVARQLFVVDDDRREGIGFRAVLLIELVLRRRSPCP